MLIMRCCADCQKTEKFEAVRSIGLAKAPGPNGFTTLFYQRYSNVVKPEVVTIVRSFFENGNLLYQMNYELYKSGLDPKIGEPIINRAMPTN